MAQNSTLKTTVGLMFLALIGTGASGCNEEAEVKKWVDKVNSLRTAAITQSEVVPYRTGQYGALKGYFAEISQMALQLKNDPDLSEAFNKAVAKLDLKAICPKVFVDKQRWETMIERCSRNRFFLCAEEVRAYPDVVRAMREQLVPEQQRRFDQTPACAAAL